MFGGVDKSDAMDTVGQKGGFGATIAIDQRYPRFWFCYAVKPNNLLINLTVERTDE